MNIKMVLKNIGTLLCVEAGCMLPSLLVSILYGQQDGFAFLWAILITAAAGLALRLIKSKNTDLYARDGLAIVALGWILLSVFGALPFLFSGAIPSVVDAIFETVSGFTTTGASILQDIESLPRGILFWRSFTHWMGGMGVLVLMMAILPSVKASSLHIMKAESPGPSTEKVVPKIGQTARIMYTLYLILTAVEVILLLAGGMPLYDSLIHAFSTAGTGGFSNRNASVAAYDSTYIDVVITVFMLMFGVNFSLYYAAVKGGIKAVLRDEELRFYLGTFAIATILITFNIHGEVYHSIGSSLRYSAFQVSSVMTTTGFVTSDFNLWPAFSQCILLLLMFIGASAGSTGGGIKCIRMVLLFKVVRREITKLIHPRAVQTVKVNGRVIEEGILSGVTAYFFFYILIFVTAVLAVLLVDERDLVTSSTAVMTTINNVGPGLGEVGPVENFSGLSGISKIILSLCMLIGRLEIYPIMLLFFPSFWKRI